MSSTALNIEDTTVNKTRSLPSNERLSEIHGHLQYPVLHGSWVKQLRTLVERGKPS